MENKIDPFMGFPDAESWDGEGPDYHPPHNETSSELRNEESGSTQPLDSQFFIDAYDWTENNLPVGFSFDSDYRIPTPDFMKGWTYEPPEERTYEPPEETQEEDPVEVTGSRRPVHAAQQVVDPPDVAANARAVRRSTRRLIAPRTPFPSSKPAWGILATDFQSTSAIPRDILLWCPCCTQPLSRQHFKTTFTNLAPVETCIRCRMGQADIPNGVLVCWSDHKGCGRLLPSSKFSGSHTHEAFTGVYCHDCRAFGHNRARFEGRYVETT
ncbi:hypothetical protein GGR53DRAFT_462947 [Hypoxylon sp. FL1150]|nr:hypothetical protein GGR53DRAFT_462947 [Hypoxylon sp. FL1150]